MTERSTRSVSRTNDILAIGGNSLAWRNDALEIEIADTAAPLPLPMQGNIQINPTSLPAVEFALEPEGRHQWSPIAPLCRVTVDLKQPDLQWSGLGYLDANRGVEPLECGFQNWTWSRAHTADQGCVVHYDGVTRRGPHLEAALRIDKRGAIDLQDPAPMQALSKSVWQIDRLVRADEAKISRTLEDTPFYARTELDVIVAGHRGPAVQESLDLDRFSQPWVRTLLPFRMPRRA